MTLDVFPKTDLELRTCNLEWHDGNFGDSFTSNFTKDDLAFATLNTN